MNVHDTVKKMMLTYPSLYKSRMACFSHMFATTGGGYDWVNGEMVALYDDTPMPTEIDRERGYLPPDKLSTKYELMVRDFIEKNIDEVVEDSPIKYNVHNVYPMSKNYCKMYEAALNPENINRDWRLAIEQFCHWILAETNGAYQITDDSLIKYIPEGKIRDNYDIAKEVKDMIILPEEKEARKEIMRKVREMQEKRKEKA